MYALETYPSDLINIQLYLSLVLYIEGTLNVGRQVFESSYEESDTKQLLQKSRGKPSFLFLVGVGWTCIQGAGRFQISEQIQKEMHVQINKQMQ